MRNARRVTPLLLVVVGLAVGCGGSGDSGPPAPDEVVLKVEGMV